MPIDSYQEAQRLAGSSSLVLRVNAAGLDALFQDPSVASVAPTGVPGTMQRISAAWVHALAIKADGTLWTWGGNWSGQLGDGTMINRWRPTSVLAEVVAAAAGQDHTIALKRDGSVWAWGRNNEGQLGDGTFTDRVTKAQVMSGVAAVWATQWGSGALTTSRSLWLWGDNGFGRIGDGTYNSRSRPVQVMTDVVAVGAGKFHTLAVKADRSLWAWGFNGSGQLGDGTTMRRSSPLRVMTNVTDAAAGEGHSLALRTDNSLWAWGNNWSGQLGDGTTANRWSPVQIMVGVVSISARGGFSLALKADGSLWAWGNNANGQLGDGTRIGRTLPVEIMRGVAAMAAGDDYTLALKSDGSVWAWGNNANGQLGDGTNLSRPYPQQVLDFGPATALPNSPSGLIAASVSQTQISLSWADNANNELGYRIERRLVGGAWTTVVDVAANWTGYVDSGLIAGTTYQYRILAFNGAGRSGYSNEASATTLSGSVGPAAPTGLTATANSQSKITLRWRDRSSNEAGFRIERRVGAGAWSQIGQVGPNVITYANTALSAATTYSYRVFAYNASGVSAFSNEASATTQGGTVGKPTAPSTLVARASSRTQIDLTWADRSSNEQGFTIERKIGTAAWVQIAQVSANTRRFANTGLMPNTPYRYRVRAFNTAGTSAYATSAVVRTPR
jgi:alpha-tubulin suppressor-like RCC1 family protein